MKSTIRQTPLSPGHHYHTSYEGVRRLESNAILLKRDLENPSPGSLL